MFADVKVLKALLKKAYKGTGVTIEDQYGGMAIHTDFWGVWITEEDLTNDIKAAVVEVLGELPKEDKAWTCRAKRDNQQALPKTLFDMQQLLGIAKEQSERARITPLMYIQKTESKDLVLCRVIQGTKRLKEYDELGKVPLFGSIALINNAFADWIADDNKDMKVGNEQRPVGPMMSLENRVVVWYNDRCLMYCYMRDDSKEREEEMIKTLEMREW